jgi:hypothetical protein
VALGNGADSVITGSTSTVTLGNGNDTIYVPGVVCWKHKAILTVADRYRVTVPNKIASGVRLLRQAQREDNFVDVGEAIGASVITFPKSLWRRSEMHWELIAACASGMRL